MDDTADSATVFTGQWVPLGCRLLGCTGLNWAVLDRTRLFCTLLGCVGLYRAAVGCTGLQWALQGLHQAEMDSSGLTWT